MAARSTPEAARGLPRLTDPTRVATSNTRASTSHADIVATNGATGLSGIATTLRDAPDKSPDERGRTTAGPPRCGVDAVEPRIDATAKRPRSRVNRPRGRIHHVLSPFRLYPSCTHDGP